MQKFKVMLAAGICMAFAMFAFASPISAAEVLAFTEPQLLITDIVAKPEMAQTAILAVDTYGGSKSILKLMLLFVALSIVMKLAKPKTLVSYCWQRSAKAFYSLGAKIEVGWPALKPT